ncbi:YfcE family phosphodiesterase [Thermococcus sp. LS1]|uniref:YfcE family phosphodiesterase n=1 Tax=Thermococcus sp. LS1 TaxID=1638259 RepID=UPI001439E997|nr:YfcE family phosphodiesterase [Thermococcus sp. LS1]NJD99386.1 YfcE family phosphodiesterase [Thermococcus sp. LS1]
MRLLAVTDIHGNSRMSKKLAETVQNEDFDALLIAGDLTHFTGAETAEKVLEPIMNLGKPIIAVHGNCDGRDVPGLLEKLGITVHNKRAELNGLGIIGIGGSNITPFNTVWELSEEEIRDILEQNYHDGDIILSHVPPYNTIADRVHSGIHVGSRALREFIEEKQPPLVVCGHIHEGRGIDRIGETLIVNPGPLFRGYYAVVDVGEEVKAKLEKI